MLHGHHISLLVLIKHARLQRSLWLSQQCYLHFVPRVLHFSAIHCICVFSESKSLRLQWSRLSYLWDLQLFQVSTAKSSVRMCFKGNDSCFVCKQAQVKLDIYTDRFSANRSLKIWHNYFLVQLNCSCSSRKYKSAILYTVYMYIPLTCYAIHNTDCCVVALLPIAIPGISALTLCKELEQWGVH